MAPSPSRVADRYLVRLAANEVVSTPLPRVARRNKAAARVREELSAEVLAAFGEAVVGSHSSRVAGITGKLKQLWEMFQSAPKKWAEFKKLLRVKSDSLMGLLRELPGKIKGMFRDAQKWLQKTGQLLVEKLPPLKLYLDLGRRLPTVGDWLKNSVEYMPGPVKKAISAGSTKAKNLASWIDEMVKRNRVIKPAAVLISAGLFAYIWFNVTELSWDIPEILRGFLGGYSFVELLGSLPESGLGLLIGMLFPGIPGGLVWNAILPITIALRLAWLIQKGIVKKRGREYIVDWNVLGLEPPPAQAPAPVST